MKTIEISFENQPYVNFLTGKPAGECETLVV